MRQAFVIWRITALLAALSSEAESALGKREQETDSIAADAIVGMQNYVTRFGIDGQLLHINPVTGVLSENILVGTTTDLDICTEIVLAHTNFQNAVGEEVIGHFIFTKVGTKLKVVDFVFGEDPSLRRFQEPDCQYWSSEIPKLRLVTQPD